MHRLMADGVAALRRLDAEILDADEFLAHVDAVMGQIEIDRAENEAGALSTKLSSHMVRELFQELSEADQRFKGSYKTDITTLDRGGCEGGGCSVEIIFAGCSVEVAKEFLGRDLPQIPGGKVCLHYSAATGRIQVSDPELSRSVRALCEEFAQNRLESSLIRVCRSVQLELAEHPEEKDRVLEFMQEEFGAAIIAAAVGQ